MEVEAPNKASWFFVSSCTAYHLLFVMFLYFKIVQTDKLQKQNVYLRILIQKLAAKTDNIAEPCLFIGKQVMSEWV